MPKISKITVQAAPMNTKFQGRFPFITPSVTSFINVACGAESSFEPNPQAVFKRIKTPPIVKAEITAPINSPICCFLGVAPRR